MMDAHIQFAPLDTLERHNDPAWNRAGRTLYDSRTLSFMPGRTEIPLLIDHDKNRRVGVVNTLYQAEEQDGPWLCAACRVTAPPVWLGRNTPASFAFLPVQESSFVQAGEADHIRQGWITEVSILSPGTAPAEPRARVTTVIKPTEQPKPPITVAAAAPIVLHRTRTTQRDATESAELRRRQAWLEDNGYRCDLEDVLDNLKSEVGYGRDMSREWRRRTVA